ncbi:hypothetical protein ACNOYE_08440 [Nannocystaceae bacterium ST9]
MAAPRLRPLLVALALTLPLDLACKRDAQSVEAPEAGEDRLDRLTRDLLLALRRNDEAGLPELAGAELLASLDEPARVELHETLDWLGAIDELTKLGEQPVEGGVERRYAIRFENGEVELTITSQGDRVQGLLFAEDQWRPIVERAAAAAVGDLRVAEFAFTDPKGEPLPAPSDPKAIHYSIALEGLAAELREHEVGVVKAVFDHRGAQVYKEPGEEELRFPEAEVGSTGGRISGRVAVPGKGEYELELRITDRIAGDTIVHRQAFAIE